MYRSARWRMSWTRTSLHSGKLHTKSGCCEDDWNRFGKLAII